MSVSETTRKHASSEGPGKKSRRPKRRPPRVAWWQPDRPLGAILAPLIAGLACPAILAVTQHIHLYWQ